MMESVLYIEKVLLDPYDLGDIFVIHIHIHIDILAHH